MKKIRNLNMMGAFKMTLNFGKQIASPHLAPDFWNHLQLHPPIVTLLSEVLILYL